MPFFYPRSPCGERRHSCRADAGDQPFSIHALLAESDHEQKDPRRDPQAFSIHALLAESDALTGDGRSILIFSIHALLAESD